MKEREKNKQTISKLLYYTALLFKLVIFKKEMDENKVD
jgi:hypothetical protein